MTLIDSALFRNILLLAAIVLCTACGGKQMSIEEFQNMAREAEEHSESIAEQQSEIRDIMQSYNQTVGADRKLALILDPETGLSEDQLARLEEHIDSETDESCQELLTQIFVLQAGIDTQREELHEITAELPEPHRVARGENHYTLCMNYLMTEHQLSRHRADSIVARVALSSDIIEGFHVWYLYQNDVFGTFVTQGDAHISPTVFAKVVKKNLLEQARKQGRHEAFESILDSLKRSGALLANFRDSISQ